jgi:leader peptidase (prepilin peptidase)/N-methyltransferase
MEYLVVTILGLVAGSFVDVVIYRIPRKQGVVWGRSFCPHCGRFLTAKDLVPLFSFFLLKGHCRYCSGKISWVYPIVEFASAGIWILAFYFFRYRASDLIFSIFFLEILLALFVIDLRKLLLPDKVILTGLVGTLFFGLFEKTGLIDLRFSIFSINHLIAALLLGGFSFAVWFLSRGKWLGFGDVKLLGWLGLVLGLEKGIGVFYLAIVLGGLTGLILLLTGRAKLSSKLPLGSFICFSAGLQILSVFNLLDYFGWQLIFR